MTNSSIGSIALGLLLVAGVLTVGGWGRARAGEISMSAEDLNAGFEVRRMILDEKGGKLGLDARAFRYGKTVKGIVTTDVLDMGPARGVVGLPADVKSVGVEVKGDLPAGTSATVETRSGASFFDQKGWSPWKKFTELKVKALALKGRYFQVRITLTSKDKTKLPALTGMTLKPQAVAAPGTSPDPAVVKENIQKIVKSPVVFHYERPDYEKLVKFRKEARLDEVISGKLTENYAGKPFCGSKQAALDRKIAEAAGAGEDFLQLIRLMDWTGSCFNDRDKAMQRKTYLKPGYYDWNIENVWKLVEVEEGGKKIKRPTIYGHCMSYSEVMTIAATVMGFKARHLAVVGVRERSHEVCEAWVPSLGKWVYFDPSLSNYYYDKKTKVPMCIIEMHKVITENFIPEGKTVSWFMSRGKYSGEVKKYVAGKGGGKKPIGSRLGLWRYGAPMPANYDWGWRHGYMVSGFVQITARNDFHANPKKHPRRFGSYPGYAGYPSWVDKKTPYRRRSTPVTRMRDFYWTLDQAAVKLVGKPGTANEIAVELGNSMLFFKEYVVEIDGKKVAAEGSALTWKLKAGENTLKVTPVDEFGAKGLPSSVTLKLGK